MRCLDQSPTKGTVAHGKWWCTAGAGHNEGALPSLPRHGRSVSPTTPGWTGSECASLYPRVDRVWVWVPPPQSGQGLSVSPTTPEWTGSECASLYPRLDMVWMWIPPLPGWTWSECESLHPRVDMYVSLDPSFVD
jgi:hypothetical protein